MSTLLINGCSYTTNWNITEEKLGSDLGYTNTVNLSVAGSSNDGIIRRTINYILEHKVDMAIISLTFWSRQEAPWATNSGWTDYGSNGIFRPNEVDDVKIYQSYIDARYKYDLTNEYIEKFLDSVIMLSGWLESKQIKYLIFSGPINFNLQILRTNNLSVLKRKLEYVRLNPNILDLENWSSNQYMYEQGGKWIEADNNVEPSIRHYIPESYEILNKFIVDRLIHDK